MTEEARECKNSYHREYLRKWRAKNKEKVKKSNALYWERRAEREKENQQNNQKA